MSLIDFYVSFQEIKSTDIWSKHVTVVNCEINFKALLLVLITLRWQKRLPLKVYLSSVLTL